MPTPGGPPLARWLAQLQATAGASAALEALARWPRHWFLDGVCDAQGVAWPVGPDCADSARLALVYRDEALPVAWEAGRAVSSTTQPSLMLTMLRLLELRPGARVLEIGTATGWNAALLGELVGPSGAVTSLEVDPRLAALAAGRLRALGVGPQVQVVAQDGFAGHPAAAPFDAMVATMACPDLPPAWLQQLAPGGRLVLPLLLPNLAAPLLRLRREAAGWQGQFHGWSWFVAARGAAWPAQPVVTAARRDPLLAPWLAGPAQRWELPWAAAAAGGSAACGMWLLATAEPGLTAVALADPAGPEVCWALTSPAGLAVLQPGAVVGYGDRAVAQRLRAAVARFQAAGAPGLPDWLVAIDRPGAADAVLRYRSATLTLQRREQPCAG
ncbi:MAG: hypothetical protein IT204_01900 [Fimbriimonadaceae bacterium]|nr:hypothetical protein [Fimbriimonadaceae bacterium]